LGMLIYMLFFYQSSLNLIRIMLAASISFYNIKNIEERKLVPFLLLSLVAISFHTTAIVVVPFYFLFNYLIVRRQKFTRLSLYIIIFYLMLNYQQILAPILS